MTKYEGMDDFYYVSLVPAGDVDRQLATIEFKSIANAITTAKVFSFYSHKTAFVLHQKGNDCIFVSVWMNGERKG